MLRLAARTMVVAGRKLQQTCCSGMFDLPPNSTRYLRLLERGTFGRSLFSSKTSNIAFTGQSMTLGYVLDRPGSGFNCPTPSMNDRSRPAKDQPSPLRSPISSENNSRRYFGEFRTRAPNPSFSPLPGTAANRRRPTGNSSGIFLVDESNCCQSLPRSPIFRMPCRCTLRIAPVAALRYGRL